MADNEFEAGISHADSSLTDGSTKTTMKSSKDQLLLALQVLYCVTAVVFYGVIGVKQTNEDLEGFTTGVRRSKKH